MERSPSRRVQRGYLLEVPIILVVLAIVVSTVLPHLSPTGQKIFLGIAAVPVLFGLYYMIVIPGWMPGDSGRLAPPWNWITFAMAAGSVIAGLALFIVSG
jgi:hypothetical protein